MSQVRASASGSAAKNLPANLGDAGDLGLIPGGGNGNPLQYSRLENPHGQRSLVGHSPWGCKESNTTGQLTLTRKPFALIVISDIFAQIPSMLF